MKNVQLFFSYKPFKQYFSIPATWVNLCAFWDWNLNFFAWMVAVCVCVLGRWCSKYICGKLFHPFQKRFIVVFFFFSQVSWFYRTGYTKFSRCFVSSPISFVNSNAKQMHTCNSHIAHTVETLTKRFMSWMTEWILPEKKSGFKFFIRLKAFSYIYCETLWMCLCTLSAA